MCGICGVISSKQLGDRDDVLLSMMSQALIHRGPDDSGRFADSNVRLGMRRLSIIDVAGGKQPLTNEDGSLVLVANGEIYNYVELQSELKGRGHRFSTGSDCETILHLYEELGSECVHRLRGMFAFALYDKKNDLLFVARDRIGEKPLYLLQDGERLVFSSEFKSILKAAGGKLELDRESVDLFLHYQIVPEPATLVKGIRKLAPGHCMVIRPRPWKVLTARYWDPEAAAPVEGDPVSLIKAKLDEVSTITLRSDMPVGIALSGGLDSNLIAALAAPKYKGELHAFSVGYAGSHSCDERHLARAMADKLRLPFHEIEIDTETFARKLPEIIYHCDDPIADIAALGYYSVMAEARRHGIPVMLTGFGGDELCWGYPWVLDAVKNNIGRYPNGITGGKTHFSFYEVHPAFQAALQVLPLLYGTEFKALVKQDHCLEPAIIDGAVESIPVKAMKLLFDLWLVPNCIALGDRLSMASSVELRLPLLDHSLIELMIGLHKSHPQSYQLGSKTWLKEAMKGILPEEVLSRPKSGFTPPTAQWILTAMKRYGYLLGDGYLVKQGILDPEKWAQFLRSSLAKDGYVQNVMYRILTLEMWCRAFIETHVPMESHEDVELPGTPTKVTDTNPCTIASGGSHKDSRTPVILITYNRPQHTAKVLESLKAHKIENLFIFSDAPKDEAAAQSVAAVRKLIGSIDWCKPVIVERRENFGLAKSIVSAIDMVFEQYDRLILLEDDCVPGRYFFDFMEDCLAKYENNQRVFGIQGYGVQMPDEFLKNYPYDGYFCPRIGSWGWATWKRAWKHYDRDLMHVVAEAVKNNVDLTQGGNDFPGYITSYLQGKKKDVWTLNWVVSVYLNNGVYIYPTRSHVENIGLDGSGVHCGTSSRFDTTLSTVKPSRYPDNVTLHAGAMQAFKKYVSVDPIASETAIKALRQIVASQATDRKAARSCIETPPDKKDGPAKSRPAPQTGVKVLNDPYFEEIYKKVRPYSVLSRECMESLYGTARAICENDIGGNFIECGVAGGGSSALLAAVIKKFSKKVRWLWAFDAFEDTPSSSEFVQHTGARTDVSERSVRNLCQKLGALDVLKTVKGRFEHTLPQWRDRAGIISLLHVDADHYDSTMAVLENLYDHVVGKGLVQIEDNGRGNDCRRALHDFEQKRNTAFSLKQIDAVGVSFSRPDPWKVNSGIPSELVAEFNRMLTENERIESQMSLNERFALFFAIKNYTPKKAKVIRFMEIGSWAGASLHLMFQTIKGFSMPLQGIAVEPDGRPQFYEVLKALQPHVVHMKGFSHEALPHLQETFAKDAVLPEIIFVDGDHTYEGVRKDVIDYYPLLAPGGIMIFHDFLPALNDENREAIHFHHGGKAPGIRQACVEIMEQMNHCEVLEIPLLYPDDPSQTQPHLPIIPGVRSTIRAYRKPDVLRREITVDNKGIAAGSDLTPVQRSSQKALKVLNICTLDRGGAGIAAYRMHKALEAQGADSKMLVLEKIAGDDSVIAAGPHAKVSWQETWRRWSQSLDARPGRPKALEISSDFSSGIDFDRIEEVRQADIINFHWVSGMLGSTEMPVTLCGKPVVWTLHDMNPFTGGCHYSGQCEKYKHRCTGCFQLGDDLADTAAGIWQAKQQVYGRLPITVVSPSKWLGQCASQSALFKGRRVEVISNGTPVDVFTRLSKEKVRKALGLEKYKNIILFTADYASNDRKGFRHLLKALELLTDLPEETALAILGDAGGVELPKGRFPILTFGKLDNAEQIAIAYNAADVFVLPSLEDNLPNTVLEALACGIPVVASNVGGVPDVVQHGATGYLVQVGDAAGLADGIRWALKAKENGALGQLCRARAEEFAIEKQARKYIELYQDILRTHKSGGTASHTGAPVQILAPQSARKNQPQNKYPKISIVTPSFNQAKYLEKCMCSILEQDYPNLEYIVVDGGSTDGSADIIKKYSSKLHWWVSEPDQGQYHAIMKGFAHSSGTIMAWLNSDDMLHPGALSIVADIMAGGSPVEWLMGGPTIRDARGRTVIVNPPEAWTRTRYLSGNYKWIQQESTFWSRSLWERAGGRLDTEYSLAADLELWMRFFRHARFFTTNVLLGGFRYHGDQKTGHSIDKYLGQAEEILAAEIGQFLKGADSFLPPAQPIIRFDMKQDKFIVHENTPASSNPEQLVAELSARGQELAKAGSLYEALQQFITLVPHRPGAADLFTIIGNLYQATGHAPAALAAFQRALELDPRNAVAVAASKTLAPKCAGNAEKKKDTAAAARPLSPAGTIGTTKAVPAENFDHFTFSKKSHIAAFRHNEKMGPDSNLKDYQDLLILNFILDNVPPGSRLLEIGGGESRIIEKLEHTYECWNIDPLEGLGNGPRTIKHKGHKLVRDYMGNFNRELPNGYFDLVFSISSLEHVPEEETVFRNICLDIDRVLKPGGYSIHCLDVVLRKDGAWTNPFMPFMFDFCKTSNKMVPLSELFDHPDLWAMSETAYNLSWARVVKKTYLEHGKPASYNVLWQKQPDAADTKHRAALPQVDSQTSRQEKNDGVLVSAIVSTYNSERYIAECIEDLLRQTIADRLEIIVVDSGSPQNEGEIVRRYQERYSNIKYIRTQQRESVYQAWNRGIKAATGRYLTNANTDDRHYGNALEVMAQALEENPEKALAYARFVAVREVEGQREFYYESPSEHYSLEALVGDGLLIGPQPMWRRSIHEICGYFDEGLIVSSDEEFWLRIAQHRDLMFVDETLGEFLEHPGSVCHEGDRGASCFESTFVRSCYREARRRGVTIGKEGLTSSTNDFIDDWHITRLVKLNFAEKFGLACEPDVVAVEKFGSHQSTPALSAIVYAGGSLDDVKATVSAMASCHDSRVEVIVVGRHAPTALLPCLEGLKCDVTVIQMARDMGPAFARNATFPYARAGLLAFIDAGLVPEAGWAKNIIAAFATDTTVAIRGRILAAQGLQAPAIFDLGDDPLPCAIETPQFCAIRRDTFEQAGGFNALAFTHHGIELAFRIYQQLDEIDAIIYRPDVIATAQLCTDVPETVSKEALQTLVNRFPYFKSYYTSIKSLYPWSNDHVDADFYTAFNTSLILKKAAPFAAIRWAQRAVELEPLAIKACFVLGTFYAKCGKTQESISLLERVLTLSRGDLAVFCKDDSREGRENWLSVSACYVNAAALLAQSFFKLKQLGKAKTVYTQLLGYNELFLSQEQRLSFSGLAAKLQSIAPEPVEDGLADVPREAFERSRPTAEDIYTQPQRPQTQARDNRPLVSAIVSTYNSEEFMRGCLEDLERQTIADKLEIIVINSGSEQNEEDIVKEFQSRYGNIQYIKTRRESIYAAWNRAVKVAKGKYLTNANTDDRHRADAFELMAQTLDVEHDVALVWADQIKTDTPGVQFEDCHQIGQWKWEDYTHQRLKLGCCVGSQPMWRASVHGEIGYFDETLSCAGDWDMWLRIAEKHSLKHIPEFLGAYYHNENGIEHGSPTHSLYERYIVGKRYGTPYIGVIPFVDGPQYPLVSILMAAHNDRKYIAEAIESVLIQNYRRFELVVVNDGSTDSTGDIIAGFKDERLRCIDKPNGGLSSARNAGIQNSTGKFIVLVDADDVLSHDYVLEHMKAFNANPTAALIYCDHLLIDEHGHPLRELKQFEYSDQATLVRDMFRCGYPVIQPRGMLSRAAFDTIGLFDESFFTGEDYELMTRFVKARLKAVRLPSSLYKRRMRSGSLSRDGDPAKTPFHFAAIDRLVSSFDHTQLFPDVDWSTIPSDKVASTAKCLIGATLFAMAKNYHAANKPTSAMQALTRATANLQQSASAGFENTKSRQLLRDCELFRRQVLLQTEGEDSPRIVQEPGASDDNYSMVTRNS